MTERYYKVSGPDYELTYYENLKERTKYILIDDAFAKMCGYGTRTELAQAFQQCTGDPLSQWLDITDSIFR